MKIVRNVFCDMKEDVQKQVCCYIPKEVTEIPADAFLDWESLQYLYIPRTVTSVDARAFCWDHMKLVFLDPKVTNLSNAEVVPRHVQFIPILVNEGTLFTVLSEVMEFKSKLEYDPEIIQKVNECLGNKIESFLEINEARSEKIRKQQEVIENSMEQIRKFEEKSEELVKEIFKRLEADIDTALEKRVKGKSEALDKTYEKMKEQLEELKSVMQLSKSMQQEAEKVQKQLDEEIKKQAVDLKKKLQTVIREIVQDFEKEKGNIRERIIQDVTSELVQKTPFKTILVNIPGKAERFQFTELFHKDFDKILKLVLQKTRPVLLKGPAGCGKNVIVEQIAELMKLPFRYTNDVTEEHKVKGFVDANGHYVETQFFKAFTEGGLMFIDEIDNSNPSALLAINSAIGTGRNHYIDFPDGNLYRARDDFYLIAAANTFGTGADMIYSGRQALDGASLNRFTPFVIDYDPNLERNLVHHKEILPLFWKVREIVQKNTIRHVVSTRDMVSASEYLDADFDLWDIFDWTLVSSLDIHDLNVIASRIDLKDSFSNEFKLHLKRKYQVSSRL